MALHAAVGRGVVDAPASFEAFYAGQRADLHRALALTLGDAELAGEAVDEAMVRAYQRWPRLSGYDNPAGWVYRVGLNWAISRTRQRWRVVSGVVPDRGVADAPLPDEDLARAVGALPPRQRAVVVLRYHLDWSNDQIAAALGVPVGTIKSRLHRGLAALRDALESGGEAGR